MVFSLWCGLKWTLKLLALRLLLQKIISTVHIRSCYEKESKFFYLVMCVCVSNAKYQRFTSHRNRYKGKGSSCICALETFSLFQRCGHNILRWGRGWWWVERRKTGEYCVTSVPSLCLTSLISALSSNASVVKETVVKCSSAGMVRERKRERDGGGDRCP